MTMTVAIEESIDEHCREGAGSRDAEPLMQDKSHRHVAARMGPHCSSPLRSSLADHVDQYWPDLGEIARATSAAATADKERASHLLPWLRTQASRRRQESDRFMGQSSVHAAHPMTAITKQR